MILETFAINKSYNEYVDKVDDKTYKKSYFDYCNELCNSEKFTPQLIIAVILSLITMVVAGVLAWRCNAKEHVIYRCINTFLSVVFSDIYVLYYLIYRVVLKNKCY
jgi:hypothetical protein